MEKSPLLLLVFLLLATFSAAARPPATHPTEFIRSSCKFTRYPLLCEQCLSAYAPTIRHSPRGLAQAALSVSLSHAQSACTFVNRLSSGAKTIKSRQVGAVRDCIEMMSDSVDRIQRSIGEMGHMGRAGSPDYEFHISNIQTWVSAALTDDTTCLDSFSGPDVDAALRASVRKQIVSVAQVTSNALALVNKFASKH